MPILARLLIWLHDPLDKLMPPGDDPGVTSAILASQGKDLSVFLAVSLDRLAYRRQRQFFGREAAEKVARLGVPQFKGCHRSLRVRLRPASRG